MIGFPLAEKAALVAILRRRPRVPRVADLLAEHGSAARLFSQLEGAESARPRLFTDEGTGMQALLDQATSDVARWEAEGTQVISVLDPAYPENLAAVHDRPPLIFVSGRLEPRDMQSVAVIGSRIASEQGSASARAIAGHLARRGYTVVSGLAAGIDREAHTAAMAANGRTVAVIGTGLERCYPRENAALQSRIAQDGAVVSRFWPSDPPRRQSFPMRNAVMSGMALATVVVEAGPKSGARIQARQALAHGRPVFLLESAMRHAWARDLARRPATYLVTAPHEITDALARLGGAALVPRGSDADRP